MKRFLLISCLLLTAATAGAQVDSLGGTVPTPPQEQADSLIAAARTLLGLPYQLGANGPDRYDCSSFVQKAYSLIGLPIPRNTWTQIETGREIDDIQALQRGDLVFFGKRRGVRDIGHIGIVVDVDLQRCDFTFIHCGVTHGVEFQRFSHPYFLMRYITARRILPDIEPRP